MNGLKDSLDEALHDRANHWRGFEPFVNIGGFLRGGFFGCASSGNPFSGAHHGFHLLKLLGQC